MKLVLRQVVLVFGSFVFHFIMVGIPQSFGVIYSEMVSAFEIGEGEIGWIPSLYTGMFLGTGIVSGIVISAIGICKTSIAGSLLMTIGMVTSAFVTDPHLLYVTYGLTAGFGASFLALSANVMIINEESAQRRSVIVGIASSGGAVGNIVLPPFTSWCISMYGWRGCYILLGGLCLQGIVIGALLYSGENVVKPDKEKKEHTKQSRKSLRQKCRKHFAFVRGVYVYYLVSVTLTFVAYFIPFNLLHRLMLIKGQTREHSSLAISLAGAGSIVSRVLIGFIGDYKCCHRIYYFIFSLFFCGGITAVCVHLTVFWQFLLYGFFYGFGSGIFGFIMVVLIADFVGVDYMGPAFSFVITTGGLAASVGTPASGWLADTTGNYDGSFYFCAAFYLAGGLVASLIPVKWHCGPSGNVSISGNEVKKPRTDVYRIEEESSECKIRSWHHDLQL